MKKIIEKLKVSQQLSLVVLVFLVPLLLQAWYDLNDLAADAHEKKMHAEGASYIQTLKAVQLELATHRGNVALLKSGDGNRQTQISQASADLEKSFAAVRERELQGLPFKIDSLAIESDWNALRNQVATLSGPASFVQHTALIAKVRALMLESADSSGLVYSEEVDVYNLQQLSSATLPQLTEGLGVIRGKFSSQIQRLLSGREVADEEIIDVAATANTMQTLLPGVLLAVEKAMTASAAPDAGLQSQAQASVASIQAALQKVGELRAQLRSGTGVDTLGQGTAESFFADMTSLIAQVSKLWDGVGNIIVEVTQAQAEQNLKELYTVAGLLLVVVIFVCWFAAAVISQLKASLGAEPRDLAKTAAAIAAGKLDEPMLESVGVYRELKTMRDILKQQITEANRQLIETSRVKEAIQATSTSLMIADENFNIVYMNPANTRVLQKQEAEIRKRLPGFDASQLVGKSIDLFHRNPSHQRELLFKLRQPFSANLSLGDAFFGLTASAVRNAKDEVLGYVVEWRDDTELVNIQNEVNNLVGAAKLGDLAQRMTLAGKTGFFKTLAEGLNEFLGAVDGVTDEIEAVMQKVAGGDLLGRMDAAHQGKFGAIAESINDTLDKLGSVIRQVAEAADATRASGHEISQGNRQLSERTEKQSSSLEETASALEELTSNVRNTADNSRQADMLSGQTRDSAMKGGAVVERTVAAIQEISDSSEKMAEIIGVIDEIAFQTNLLALNASVEAARAGDQGRGFAVVATEVRNLAQRSANSAREIKELIQDSVRRVKLGSTLAGESGLMLQEIIGNVKKVSDLISDIAAATEEQSSGIEEINKAIAELDDITQQNAALAEETASAAESAMENTELMGEAVAFFNIADSGGASRLQRPVAGDKRGTAGASAKKITLDSGAKKGAAETRSGAAGHKAQRPLATVTPRKSPPPAASGRLPADKKTTAESARARPADDQDEENDDDWEVF